MQFPTFELYPYWSETLDPGNIAKIGRYHSNSENWKWNGSHNSIFYALRTLLHVSILPSRIPETADVTVERCLR